ncbi:MAG: LysE family transporter [Alphaproteobacteria bacterium]|nr:LysE family transporter [Alphaproteobacteria bacterium]
MMDDFLTQWLLLASIQAAVTIWPGPAFAVAVKQSLAHGRIVGVFTSLGLSAGVAFHVVLVIAGMVTLIKQVPIVFTIIRYAGAVYLIYIGLKAIISLKAPPSAENTNNTINLPQGQGAFKAFQIGLITNFLNPKAMVFFSAVFAQFIGPDTPWQVAAIYTATSATIEFLWFLFVTVVLTNPAIKASFLNFAQWIERTCGGILIAMGLKMLLVK